jgi:hypothetical protein
MVGWEVQFRHRVEELKKHYKEPQDNRYSCRYSNRVPLEYISKTLQFQPTCSIACGPLRTHTKGRLAVLWGLWHKVQFPEPTGKGTTVVHTYNCSSLGNRGRWAMRVLPADLLTEHVGAVSRQHTVHPETLKLRKTDPRSLWWRQETLKARKTHPSSLWLK